MCLRLVGVAALVVAPFALRGSAVTGLTAFANGELADATDVNANFTALATAVNDNDARLARFTFSGNNVGVGATPVQPRLQVNGALLIGSDTEVCNATTNGMLRVKNERLEYCAASQWRLLVAVPATAAQIEVAGTGRRWTDGTYAASCNDYRNPPAGYSYAGATGTGTYTIKQNGSTSPTDVHCDMATATGGWTLVFQGTDNQNSTALGYASGTAGNDSVVSRSTSMMFAYLDTSSKAVSNVWTFATPAAFRTATPMATGQCIYTSVVATRLADGSSTTQTLRSGWGSFGSNCDEGCTGTYGQICLKNTPAQGTLGGFSDFPFFTGFAAAGPDYCAHSNQTYSVTACTATRQFAILVR